MSGYVIEIPQEKENGSIWSQQLRVAAYCRVSTPYEEQQQSLEKQIESGVVVHQAQGEKSILEVCCCVCGQCLWTPREESARIPKDAERLPER